MTRFSRDSGNQVALPRDCESSKLINSGSDAGSNLVFQKNLKLCHQTVPSPVLMEDEPFVTGKLLRKAYKGLRTNRKQ